MTGKQIEKRFNAFKTAVAILIALALAFIVIALISDTPVKVLCRKNPVQVTFWKS